VLVPVTPKVIVEPVQFPLAGCAVTAKTGIGRSSTMIGQQFPVGQLPVSVPSRV
jgi:hypothetical protein